MYPEMSLPSSDEGSSDDRQVEKTGWNVYRPEKPFSQVSVISLLISILLQAFHNIIIKYFILN